MSSRRPLHLPGEDDAPDVLCAGPRVRRTLRGTTELDYPDRVAESQIVGCQPAERRRKPREPLAQFGFGRRRLERHWTENLAAMTEQQSVAHQLVDARGGFGSGGEPCGGDADDQIFL